MKKKLIRLHSANAACSIRVKFSPEDDQSILIETLKPTVLFRTTPTHLEIVITWCYRKPFHLTYPPCKVSNPNQLYKIGSGSNKYICLFPSNGDYFRLIEDYLFTCVPLKTLETIDYFHRPIFALGVKITNM